MQKLPLFLWSAAAPFIIVWQRWQWTISSQGWLDRRDFRSEFLQIHIEKLQSELFLAEPRPINDKKRKGVVAMARVTKQLLQARRQMVATVWMLQCQQFYQNWTTFSHFKEEQGAALKGLFSTSDSPRCVSAWHGAVTAPTKPCTVTNWQKWEWNNWLAYSECGRQGKVCTTTLQFLIYCKHFLRSSLDEHLK